uniref:phage tail tape measure protein n=1 Tax=Draconibacterium sp. TaxID=1965318 RepID=UPI0035619CE8
MSNLQDDVRKFVLEIEESKNNGETLANLTKLQKETAKYRQENEELQKVMAHLDAKGQRNSKTYKEMEAKLKANKKAIQQNGVAMKGLEKNLDTNYMSMGQLKKRAMELRSALNTTSKAANPEEYNRLETELKQVGKQMDVLKGKSNQTQGFLGKMKGAAAGIMPALGPAALVAGAGAAAKKIFDLSKQTMEYRQQMQKLTGESGQQLADLTAQVDASAKTFQKDFNELAVANHNFAQSMGIAESASQRLIDKGFIAGADASGEFLDRLREYGPQFKAAGVDAETAIAIMTQEVKSGIYSDKGSDTIKEGTIRLREMTKATREALNGIGISSTKLEAELKKGTITYFDAIQMVSNKLGELPAQSSAVGTAIADIFGGPGEDAGLEYIKMLGTVESSMDKMIEGAGETAQAQQNLLDANNKLSKAWSDMLGTGTGTFTSLKAGAKSLLADGIIGVTKGLAGIRDWFVAIYNESLPVRAGVNYML